MTISAIKLPLTLRIAAVSALLWLLAVSACGLEHFLPVGRHRSSHGHEHSPAVVAHQHDSDSPRSSHANEGAHHLPDAEGHSHGSHKQAEDGEIKSSSGLDLIKQILGHTLALPVVATTMFDVQRTERLALAAGASGFVAKQDGPVRLIEVVREFLKKASTNTK